jgi:hypothetical protein
MNAPKKIYVIGSLANKKIPHFANRLRTLGFEVFDQWWSPGPLADSYLLHYAKIRGMSYKETLADYAAKHIFEFDRHHILAADIVIMLMPSGKSGHMETGFAVGKGKKVYVLFESEPKRFDVMYGFATEIFTKEKDLRMRLKEQL